MEEIQTTFNCDVIADIVFDRGLFYFSIKNLDIRPVFKVSIHCDNKIMGVDGVKEISAMNLFQNIEFLAPGKEITTFVDTSYSYFKNRQPEKFTLLVRYTDASGNKRSGTIYHDLSIYRDIGYITRREH